MNNIAVSVLEDEEGWREHPYYCSNRYPTVGYGFKIGDQDDPLPKFKLLRSVGKFWLKELVNDLQYELEPHTAHLSEEREAILISMAYQMGIEGVLGFVNTWDAIKAGNFDSAADHMLDSEWYREDTPGRAMRHSEAMRTGRV